MGTLTLGVSLCSVCETAEAIRGSQTAGTGVTNHCQPLWVAENQTLTL